MNEFHGINIYDMHMLIVFSYIPYWWVGERSVIVKLENKVGMNYL
jgi:hypothetical protein